MFRDQRTAYRNVLYFEARLLIEIWSPSGRLGHLAVSTSQSWGHRCTPHLPFFFFLKSGFWGWNSVPPAWKTPALGFFFFYLFTLLLGNFWFALLESTNQDDPRSYYSWIFLPGLSITNAFPILRQSKTHLLFLRRELCFTSLRGCCIG